MSGSQESEYEKGVEVCLAGLSGSRRRIVDLELHILQAAQRFFDIARLIERDGPYSDLGFLKASGERYWKKGGGKIGCLSHGPEAEHQGSRRSG